MLTRHTHKKVTWIDLESPTSDEVREIMKEFNIHPLAANELLSPTLRPKVDKHDNYIYLILHFPAFQHNHKGDSKIQEVDFIIGKDFIITTHYEMIDSLHDFSKMFEVSSITDKSHIGEHAGFVFYYLMRELYKSLVQELDHIDDELELIESNIFIGHEREMVKSLSHTSRDLLNFKQSIRLHKNVLDSLEISGAQFFGAKFSYYLHSITGEYYKIASTLEGHRETLIELRKTNDSLLSTKQNEIMKILTIVAFITFPLSLIAGIFGMNTKSLPIVGAQGDFWIVMFIMLLATFAMFAFFRYKKWL
ncbi:magnesium transporter CorA family protein [Patescibacteria group bacterium]